MPKISLRRKEQVELSFRDDIFPVVERIGTADGLPAPDDWLLDFFEAFEGLRFSCMRDFSTRCCGVVGENVISRKGDYLKLFNQVKSEVNKEVIKLFGGVVVKKVITEFWKTLPSRSESCWSTAMLRENMGEEGEYVYRWCRFHFPSFKAGISALLGEQEADRVVLEPSKVWDDYKTRKALRVFFTNLPRPKTWNRKIVDDAFPSGLTERLVFVHDSFENGIKHLFGEDSPQYKVLEDKRVYRAWNSARAQQFINRYLAKFPEEKDKIKRLNLRSFSCEIDGKRFSGRGFINFVKREFGSWDVAVNLLVE